MYFSMQQRSETILYLHSVEHPITPADIYALGTAMDVADHYVLSYDKPAIVATVVLLGLCVFACKLRNISRSSMEETICCISDHGNRNSSKFFLHDKSRCSCKIREFKVNFLATENRILKNGYILSFLMNIQYTIVSQPEGYSRRTVNKIADNYQVTQGSNKNLKQKPNVVVIMNETFSDLNVVNKIKTNKEVMPFINSLNENTIKGHMLVSVFGGGTSNSEYEFLNRKLCIITSIKRKCIYTVCKT